MIFNSFQFIWLFPLIFIGYYLLSYLLSGKFPERQRKMSNALLLIVSYGLYAQTNMAYTLILLGVTLITYLFALFVERCDANKRKKHLIACGASLALLPLLVFKYYNFIINTTQSFLESIHSTPPHFARIKLGNTFGYLFLYLSGCGVSHGRLLSTN